MDHAAAQATFVEITFAVNLLFAAYATFRDYLKRVLANNVLEYEARTKAIEPNLENVTRLAAIKASVTKYAKQFSSAQHICVCSATVVSLIAALCCIVVLFFDFLAKLGHHTGWLILPLPLYFALSATNFGIFHLRSFLKVRRFKKLIDEFETVQIPPEISGEKAP